MVITRVTRRVPYLEQEMRTFPVQLSLHSVVLYVLVGIVGIILSNDMSPWCDVPYDLPVITMSGSSLFPFVCREFMFY
jgi:hypothetical protein